MRRLFSAALLLFVSLAAAEYESSFTADTIDYDGEALFLDGAVTITHGGAFLHAGRARLTDPYPTQKWHFNRIFLEEGVKVTLSQGDTLEGGSAELNDKQLVITCFGAPHVVYKSGESQVSVVLKSEKMETHLVHQAKKERGALPSCGISYVLGSGNVVVCYDYDYVATGDRVSYKRLLPIAEEKMEGVITLEGQQCEVTSSRGDLITASRIDIDTLLRKMVFTKASGKVQLQDDTVEFKGARVVYHDSEGRLLFEGATEISHELLGNVATDELLSFTGSIDQGLETIESCGETRLQVQTARGGTLFCDGLIHIGSKEGKVLLDKGAKQIRYSDPLGDFYADQVVVNYKEERGRLVPKHLSLSGHVRMTNQIGTKGGTACQYALADHLEFSPESEELLLTASEQTGRILFYDEVNQVKMSAPGLTMSRGEKSREIKGLGDVRFSFFDEEVEKLKERFRFECLNFR